MEAFDSVRDLVGGTPVLHLQNLQQAQGLSAALYGKLEGLNPAGSVKDRIAKAMLDAALQDGRLQPGGVIVEPTSGNTGIGLAAIGVPRGFRVILTMPETMTEERQRLLRLYGAELVLTDGREGMSGSIKKAQEIVAETPGAFMPDQFSNPANPAAHVATTGPELWAAMNGQVDIFVAGVGTGGTITGVGRFLKSKNPHVRVVAVEPAASPVLSGGKAGPHRIQGIGAGFVPAVLDKSVYDEVMAVEDAAAIDMAHTLAQQEGVLAGISSGAAVCAAVALARLPENTGKRIVAVLPDTGDRYLSML